MRLEIKDEKPEDVVVLELERHDGTIELVARKGDNSCTVCNITNKGCIKLFCSTDDYKQFGFSETCNGEITVIDSKDDVLN